MNLRPFSRPDGGGPVSDEEELRQSQRLALLVQLSHDAIVVWRAPGVVETWSDGAERLYGYSREEVVGRPLPIRPDGPVGIAFDADGGWEGEVAHRTGTVARSSSPHGCSAWSATTASSACSR